jgi:hypothetical protein
MLATTIARTPDAFTTTAFPGNPHARRIYRTMSDIPSFSRAAQETELQMAVIAGYEYALAYINEVEAFSVQVRPGPADTLTDDAPEEQLYAKMTLWRGTPPAREPYRTLGYLRLVRNHYAHVNDVPSPALVKFIAKYAHHLQRHWNKSPSQIGNLKFRTLVNRPLTTSHAYPAMNLLRAAIEQIDKSFAATLRLDNILPLEANRLYEHVPGHDRAVERFVPKLRAAIRERYGETFSAALLEPYVRQFLTERRVARVSVRRFGQRKQP